jgi:hypothetical protein
MRKFVVIDDRRNFAAEDCEYVSHIEIDSVIKKASYAFESFEKCMELYSVVLRTPEKNYSPKMNTTVMMALEWHKNINGDYSTTYGLESFNSSSRKVALEGIGSFIQRIWEAVKNFFKNIWNWMTKLFDSNDRIVSNSRVNSESVATVVAAVETRIEAETGTGAGSNTGKVKEFKSTLRSLAGIYTADDTDDVATFIKRNNVISARIDKNDKLASVLPDTADVFAKITTDTVDKFKEIISNGAPDPQEWMKFEQGMTDGLDSKISGLKELDGEINNGEAIIGTISLRLVPINSKAEGTEDLEYLQFITKNAPFNSAKLKEHTLSELRQIALAIQKFEGTLTKNAKSFKNMLNDLRSSMKNYESTIERSVKEMENLEDNSEDRNISKELLAIFKRVSEIMRMVLQVCINSATSLSRLYHAVDTKYGDLLRDIAGKVK